MFNEYPKFIATTEPDVNGNQEGVVVFNIDEEMGFTKQKPVVQEKEESKRKPGRPPKAK